MVAAEIDSLIDNHRKEHWACNSGGKIIIFKWIVFSQLSLCLGAGTVKRNRTQIKCCERFWLDRTRGEKEEEKKKIDKCNETHTEFKEVNENIL